jgi:cytochrome c553
MAAGLSEDDMANLAAFYSSQTLKVGEADPALVEKGKEIFMSGNAASGVAACSSCHAPNGVGNPAANFPALQGQHADYTVKQLKDFRAGNRANDAGKMMQNVAAKMTDEEIAAVSSYIQGLN